jgi:cold shock CspA family protein
MPTGKIDKWFDNRGFGFLSDDDRPDASHGTFVHISALRAAPAVGDRFSYDINVGLDGRTVAANVRPITAETEEAARVFG